MPDDGQRSSARLVAACAAFLCAGCSLSVSERDACTETRDCVATFGFGSSCGEDGYCSPAVSHPRCTRTHPADLFDNPQAYADRILIGSMFSYQDHNASLLAAELAVRQVNGRSGLDGTRYAIAHCDYTDLAGDELDSVTASEQLAGYLANDLQVPAIVGPRGSSRTAAAFSAIRDSGVVVMSPSATSPELTTLDVTTAPTDTSPGFLWRTAPPDNLQANVIAFDMAQRNIQNVAVLFQAGSYGESLLDLFITEFADAGGGQVTQFPFPDADLIGEQVATIASELDSNLHDEVLFISSAIDDYKRYFGAASATAELEATFSSVGIFLPDAAYDSQLLEEPHVSQAAQLLLNVRGTRPAPATGTVYDAFAASYSVEYGEDVTSAAFAAHSYDAAWLLLYGSAWSQFDEGGISGHGIARGLRRLSGGESVEIKPSGWTNVVESFRQGAGVDIEGASGLLDFNPATEETSASISVWRIIDQGGEPNFQEDYVRNPD